MYRKKITKRRLGIRRMARKTRKSRKASSAAALFKRMVCTPEVKQTVQNFDASTVNGYDIISTTSNSTTLLTTQYAGGADGIVNWPVQGVNDYQRIGDQITVKSLTFHIIISNRIIGQSLLCRIVFFTSPFIILNGSGVAPLFWKYSHYQNGIMGTVNRERYNVLYDKIHQVRSYNNTDANAGGNFNKIIRGTLMKNQFVQFDAQGEVKHKKHKIYMAFVAGGLTITDNQAKGKIQAFFKLNYIG
jgi:hypothetical protein